ncbi:ATP-dependent nuclease [Paenibacillus polymyxa]|uniref:ATP-dependent nuclease n=1 Tax=Paenibacillus polymyxa TaxID=1406 RepID=UPI002378ECC7|nr:AAA family ATPase [Paenibacillus polymyxa]WDM22297.1 AAA family ATPase [Paenibacillus polymyxa]
MHISKLIIRNFRNFKNAVFTFTHGVNTLIGENGSGKTNAFYAIRLLIDANLPRAVKINESDFNRNVGNWRGHWIIIQLDFADIDDNEGTQMLAHNIERMDGTSTGAYTMYFRPNRQIRQQLFELTQDFASKDELQSLLDDVTLSDYEMIFTCKGTADFSDDAIYNTYVGDFENVDFPNPEEEAWDALGIPSQKFSIYNEVTCTYIKALRDAEYELRNLKSNPLLNLVRDLGSKIDGTSIIKQVNQLNTSISELDQIQILKERVKNTVHKTIGTTYAPTIDIRSQLPENLDKLLQTLTLWVGDTDDLGYQGQISELSLGGANLLYISLKLLEYEIKQSTSKAAHFLLIEEPEAHIHTHIQKTLFEKYGYQNTQVIISTHSTHISASNRISAVNILAKRQQEAVVFQACNGLNDDVCKRIERYLDAVRSTLLFAKSVILVEGDAELILIPILFKKIFNISLDEVGVSLINMSSTVFKHVALLFDDKRIQRKCAIITDLDTSIIPITSSIDSKDKFIKKCIDSQKSGLLRKTELDTSFVNSKWVQPFYATYTFEVDFIMAGNVAGVVQTLPSIYEIKSYIDDSTEKLKKGSTEESGREILRLANKEGKGWFALLLSENIKYNTVIPDYILEAIAFTCEHFTDTHFEVIADYRIAQGIKNEDDPDNDIFKELKLKKEQLLLSSSDSGSQSIFQEFSELYREWLPKDPLTKLLCYMGR